MKEFEKEIDKICRNEVIADNCLEISDPVVTIGLLGIIISGAVYVSYENKQIENNKAKPFLIGSSIIFSLGFFPFSFGYVLHQKSQMDITNIFLKHNRSILKE